MNTKGFVHLSTTAQVETPGQQEDYQGQILQVMDWAVDGSGALVLDRKGISLGMVENEHILRSFKCDRKGDVLLPPNLSSVDQINYFAKVMMRKGGYSKDVMNITIAASLAVGELHDNHLFN